MKDHRGRERERDGDCQGKQFKRGRSKKVRLERA